MTEKWADVKERRKLNTGKLGTYRVEIGVKEIIGKEEVTLDDLLNIADYLRIELGVPSDAKIVLYEDMLRPRHRTVIATWKRTVTVSE